MNPRYQVFVSSTFRDLEGERQAVLNAVIELEHFPASMEAFPATTQPPWDLIRKVIEESDYYVLIVGGRYGSTDESGMSYTEREYDLAQELGIPTLVFLHADPMALPANRVELGERAQQSLAAFRSKVSGRHLCKSWKSPEDLKASVFASLIHAFRVNPRVGWIRGNNLDSPETLKKLTVALEQNAVFVAELEQLKKERGLNGNVGEERFAHEEEKIVIRCTLPDFHELPGRSVISTMSWQDIFLSLAPSMMTKKSQLMLIGEFIFKMAGPHGHLEPRHLNDPFSDHFGINIDDWRKIVLQFLAVGYWEEAECSQSMPSLKGGVNTFRVTGYKLTPLGVKRFAEKAAMHKPSPETATV